MLSSGRYVELVIRIDKHTYEILEQLAKRDQLSSAEDFITRFLTFIAESCRLANL